MLHRQEECFVEGVAGSEMVQFLDNWAQGAGGGAFVRCHTPGNCEHRVALTGPSGQAALAVGFGGNTARSFGRELATGPHTLELLQARRAYVPGQTALDLSFALRDALAQTMR
eukprot:721121-Rhodomonas_salina.1